MNKVFLIGRLTNKPELGYTPNTQTAVTQFTVAVDRHGDGADFIRVTAYGKQAENTCRYMDKGRQIAIEGRIQTGSYKKDGATVYTTDVIANNVEFLGRGDNREETARQIEEKANDLFGLGNDGMPF
jgi:single-strand DNA-binding protein